jgi:thiazole synthase ThiGH ThiG subunit
MQIFNLLDRRLHPVQMQIISNLLDRYYIQLIPNTNACDSTAIVITVYGMAIPRSQCRLMKYDVIPIVDDTKS